MSNAPSFKIYDASAGSGKTYTLVKEYLKILFSSQNRTTFKNILAITFTNKAVAEMKERIIETLKQFSNTIILDNPNSMFSSVCEELNISPPDLHKKSKNLLEAIVHNYAAFDISTIDGFTHKLIRTFAFDLKLPMNFEVELDQDALLNQAVDRLIAKAGSDPLLTQILVDFAIEKADDDKSWDISYDFIKIAKLLTNENDIPFIETLEDKTLDDFKALKKQLKKEIIASETLTVQLAEDTLDLIADNGLEFTDFSRGTLPNHFKKVKDLNLEGLYNNQLETNLSERKSIYTASLNPVKKETIDGLLPKIETFYQDIKKTVYHLKFLRNFYKNTTPLSVLNAINNELIALKEEQNKMLISEFNTIISHEIKDQPTPFIFERIGEKFKHYFIDEFQDTSKMQWQNLIPLLSNSLSSESGNVILVGDAKQAIYRWRGGEAEQFLDLLQGSKKPFHVEAEVNQLPRNFRSHQDIVEFNNGFFSYLANQVFSNKDYEALYEKVNQEASVPKDGYVHITFLEFNNDTDRDELYTAQVHDTINACIDNGFQFGDICVLTRKKKEGVAVANYLSSHGIPIVSSETLLINNSPEVHFLNDLLSLLSEPKNTEAKVAVLNYLATSLAIENKHSFLASHIHLSLEDFLKSLHKYGITLSLNHVIQNSLYDIVESFIRHFNLTVSSNGYLQFYLDFVLDYVNKNGSDIKGFLEHFEKKKESLSIVSPIGQNAVQIMTIHKSKGLEFPVVIFPYADLDIYSEREPREWYPLTPDSYQNFSYTLLNYTKDFENYNGVGPNIYNTHQSQLELDNINLLYVALTRPKEQLFIITKKDISAKGIINERKYSGLFISYLKAKNLWHDTTLIYEFGHLTKKVGKDSKPTNTIKAEQFLSTPKEAHNIKIVTKSAYLWDTAQQQAIEKGNLIHHILSKIETKDDIELALNHFIDTSLINSEQLVVLKETITNIVSHPELNSYFKDGLQIFNEREIIDSHGIILRPDRVVINANREAVIIDYKTGKEDENHYLQLQSYQEVLEGMELIIAKKILVYLDNEISIKIF